ncbi:MAG TPA: hypothetical protein VNM37_25440 [Candidatus Dormibacteraeota bacterium]|nr:hypothetical protein [Candidatus Dormibacteraeota bacterium]
MSQLEDVLLLHLQAAGLPEPVREYVFARPRRWRFDFCWPAVNLAVEVEGGQWSRVPGRHQRGAGLAQDATKYNTAVLRGWRVLRFTRDMIDSGEALATIEAAFGVDLPRTVGNNAP